MEVYIINPAGNFKVVSEVCVCFRVACLLSKSRTRPCVSQIGNFILCVKICTPPILMSLLPPPVLIAGLYNCADDWVPQTVWQATTTQRTQMSGSLNFTQFLILLWMIKEACPIITHEKLTQPSVWTNWGSFVCFADSQSRNLMFSPLRLGSCFPSLDQYFLWLKLVTSGWPSAPHMTSLTPTVSSCWFKALFVYCWQTALNSGETMPSN